MGAKSLAGSTGMSLQEAQDFINRYFRGFPALHRWVNQIKREASANGYVTTLMGRRRNLPRLLANSGASKERRARAEREAMNTPVQGSAADLIKVAMIKLQQRLKTEGLATKMVLQVHDELVFDAPVGEVEAVSRMIREEMCSAYPLKAKLDIDLAVGANWDAVESMSL
jgi:DNA polymerase I